MECLKCKGTMIEAKLIGDLTGMQVYLSNKKNGLLEKEHRCKVACCVCTVCGYVELKAVSPKELILE